MSAELVIGLGVLVLSLSLVAAGTITQLSQATERYHAATRTAIDDLIMAERLRAGVEELVAASRGYLLADNPSFLAKVRRSEETVEHLLAKLAGRGGTSPDQAAVVRLQKAYTEHQEFVDISLSKKATGAAPGEITELFERDLQPKRRSLDHALDAFVASREARLWDQHREVAHKGDRALTTALTTLGLGTLASVLLAALFGRHLSRLYARERQALADAERATAARDEMLAIVAHDLRNPLNAIALRAGMLREHGADERARAHGAAIRRVVVTADRLVRDMLDAAKIDAGRFVLEVASCSAREVLREVLDLFDQAAAAGTVQLDCGLEPADFVMEVDRQRVVQLLANLLGNALKFAPPGTAVQLLARSTGAEVHFQVADRGPGIPCSELAYIFERFWKGRGQGGKSTGLGLYIASKIADAHRGRIWVNSYPGQGTVFHLVLPRIATARSSVPREARAIPSQIPTVADGRA